MFIEPDEVFSGKIGSERILFVRQEVEPGNQVSAANTSKER
jgi:hypothetical protein